MANQSLVVPALAGIPTRFRLKPALRTHFAVLLAAIRAVLRVGESS